MNDMQELKNVWQNQPNSEAKSEHTLEDNSLVGLLESQRKKILRSNIIVTSLMAITVSFLSWIIVHYDDQQSLFYVSTLAMIVVIVGVLMVLWRRTLKNVTQLSLDSRSYVDHQIRRLLFNKKVIQFSPIYGLVLGIIINAYSYSLLENATTEFVFWITNINWLYIFIVGFASYHFKMKRYKNKMEPLLKELQTLSKALD